MYELDSLGPIQKSHCMEWSPKSFLFLLNCMYPYQKDPPQHCESSSHWGGPASKIQPKFFSDCSSKGRQIVQSFRVDNCQTFLCGSRLVRVKFSFESEREIFFNIFSQKWCGSFSLRGRHWQHVFYFGRPPVLKTCTAALQRHSNSTSAPIRQGYHS